MMDLKERLFTKEVKKLAPVLGKESAARVSKAYLLGDEDTKKRIMETIDVIKAAVFSDKNMRDAVLMEPPRKKEAGEGDLDIGTVLYGKKKMYPFMFNSKTLLTHMGIFGSSGYGKTNISYSMIEKLSEKGIPVLVFDFSKRNYKDLLSTPLKDKIDIYTIGRKVSPLKFNPLKPPPGIQLSQWMKEFATIFDHAYWLLGGGRHIILKALDSVHESIEKPRLKDLKDWVNNHGLNSLPARERNWLATAGRPLESLCFKEIGEIFDVNEGVKPSEFFKPGRVTILELDALDPNDKTFFIEIVLQWLRDWLLVSNVKEELNGVIILEEAHHVLNREKARKMGTETVIDLVFREIRELGMGIIYIDQHPSLVSYPALGNTSTHIYMNLGLDTKQSSDIQDASNMLGLDYEDEGNYLRRLPVGHGFMLCRISGFQAPFLVSFHKANLKKGSVSDEMIAEHMRGKIQIEHETEAPAPKREETDTSEIDDVQWSIISTIGNFRGSYASQIYKDIKASGSTFERKVKRLMDTGLVGVKKAKIKKNVLHFYFLTDKGEEVFLNKFGETKEAKAMDTADIIEALTESGWMFKSEGNSLVFDDDGKKLKIVIENKIDRKQMEADLKETAYFIVVSEKIKSALLQETAKLSYKMGRPVIIYITSPDRFDKESKFERVSFE
jgi:DNA-binding MarR family transcriptional regulator